MRAKSAVTGVIAVLAASQCVALNNGLGHLPPMAYSTWNAFGPWLNQTQILQNAAIIKNRGLYEAGYRGIHIDEGWIASNRSKDGKLVVDQAKFPSGMESFGKSVKQLGFKLGLYTSRGTEQCGAAKGYHAPGSHGFEEQDVSQMASYGATFIKVDSCTGSQNHSQAYADYSKFRDAMAKQPQPIFHSLCGWNEWYTPVGYSLGNSWRVAGDCSQYDHFLNVVDAMAAAVQWSGPGGWNDADLLITEHTPAVGGFDAPQQSRLQFSLYCVMSAPLIISVDLRQQTEYAFETYSNKEAIEVNQDDIARPGFRLLGGDVGPSVAGDGTARKNQNQQRSDRVQVQTQGSTNIWAKPLADGSIAMVFANFGNGSGVTIECPLQGCLDQLGIGAGTRVAVRDLWAHSDNGTFVGHEGLSVRVEDPTAGVMVRLTPEWAYVR